MGQLGFFDLNRRYESLTERNDPLVAIAAMVPFESFRPKLNAALIKGELRRSEAERKNSAGRKPWDEVVIFKALVLQALYNLSDDQVEYQLRDRFSLTENGLRLIRFDLEPRMRADEHIHQRALAYDQAESVAEHEAQTLVGKRLKALAIYRQSMMRGPNGVCVATAGAGALTPAPQCAQRQAKRRWRTT